MNDSTLFKLEYVRQEEEQFSGGGTALFGVGDGTQNGMVLLSKHQLAFKLK